MDSFVQTEQALLEEIVLLRARIAELERADSERNQDHQVSLHEPQQEIRSTRNNTAIFDVLSEALAVYDLEGRIVYANAAFRQLIGVDVQPEYPSLSLVERIKITKPRDIHGIPLPEDCIPVCRLLRGESLKGRDAVDLMIAALDGRQLLINANGSPLRNDQGQITGAVLQFRDVTEQYRFEQHTHDTLSALLAMAEVLVQGTDKASTSELSSRSSMTQVIQRLMRLARRVLGCRNIGVMLIDPDNDYLQPIALVGTLECDRLQWQTFFESTRLSDHVTDPIMLDRLYAGVPLKADATTQPFLPFYRHFYLLVPMHTGSSLVGIISLDYGDQMHNFTREEMALAEAVSKLTMLLLERERLLQERSESHAKELALLEASRRMDEFLSIASHELRTPLTAINGNIQLAKRRLNVLGDEQKEEESFSDQVKLIHELLNRAERQVRVQNRLVSDLLDVSRIQANRLELHMESCDLCSIVSEVVEDQRAASPSRIISLTMAAEAIPIVADADRVGQVVTNYLTNALKYSSAERPVEVMVMIEGQMARVSVRDEGPGLPAREQDRLWQCFYRVPGINVLSGTGAGLGLGLHICRTIIQYHCGDVGVDSELGNGSVFWFTIPLAERFQHRKR